MEILTSHSKINIPESDNAADTAFELLLLDQALETVFQDPEQLDINIWLKSIAALGSGPVDREIERLIARGILEASKKMLGVDSENPDLPHLG